METLFVIYDCACCDGKLSKVIHQNPAMELYWCLNHKLDFAK